MSTIKTDILILGSGVAGLTTAIKTATALPTKKIIIATKAKESDSNTRYAQGGVATVWDRLDTFESHIKDTLRAGDYINDVEVVTNIIEDAPKRIKDLISWGANFDADNTGELDLGREGGHSTHRIIHHKDNTGFEIEETLIKKINEIPNITILSHHFAIDLITEHQLNSKTKNRESDKLTCFGAYILNQKSKSIDTYLASATVIATGGVGQVYASTTNPPVATGDGIAMAYRAKANIEEMEFIQFHPTALFEPGVSPAYLISEAVRGFGAYLRNKKGERFMLAIDERAELASRDIVARAIDSQLKISGDECVYLDCTHLDGEKFKNHFPNIYEKCYSIGIDCTKDFIPVVPAAHYLCGGISVNHQGKTTINNLYACGECSRTGLHGANRLASNSLLEGLVYAQYIADDIASNQTFKNLKNIAFPEWNTEGTINPKELILISHNKKTIQHIMSDLVGIVRTDERLEKALDHLNYIYLDTNKLYERSTLSPQICELRNLNAVAYLITKQSLARKENKGAFYSLDNLN